MGRRGRGLCQGRGGGGERILLPHGLCLCHGALRGHCRGGRRRRDHLLVGPAPLHGAARHQDHLRYAGEPDPPHRAVRGRRLRQQVVHQGRAAGVGMRVEGAASGEASAQRGRGHAHDPGRRRVDLDAHRGGRRRQDHRAPGQDLHEHRGLRGEQPAGVREVVQPLRRPLCHPQRPDRQLLGLHQHGAGQLLPGFRLRPGDHGRRVPDRRARGQDWQGPLRVPHGQRGAPETGILPGHAPVRRHPYPGSQDRRRQHRLEGSPARAAMAAASAAPPATPAPTRSPPPPCAYTPTARYR